MKAYFLLVGLRAEFAKILAARFRPGRGPHPSPGRSIAQCPGRSTAFQSRISSYRTTSQDLGPVHNKLIKCQLLLLINSACGSVRRFRSSRRRQS